MVNSTEEFLFGTSMGDAVQSIVLKAIRARTPEAFKTAADAIGGISTFIQYMRLENCGTAMILGLGNMQSQCRRFANNETAREELFREIDKGKQ